MISIEYESSHILDIPYKDIITITAEGASALIHCPYKFDVSVLLTDNDQIKLINAEYRKIDSPTDVLSFPMVSYETPGEFSDIEYGQAEYFDPDSQHLILGDIVISVEKLLSQAKEYGHSVIRELAFLTAHSMLHLFGFDHIEETDRITMEEKQRELMENLQINR